MLLANLPYLPLRSRQYFERRCPDLKAEPSNALYVKKDGLRLYEKLFKHLQGCKDLKIVCESLLNQQESLQALANDAGLSLVKRHGLASLFTTKQ